MDKIKVIDLFAGLGGIRLGFEQACIGEGIPMECVFTSEIKSAALKALNKNFGEGHSSVDITNVSVEEIPDFDFLLAGFPCQPFSYAGSQKGFADTRGTLFFEIERILEYHRPTGFILENVEGLVSHDVVKGQKIGKTLLTIIQKLEMLEYCVTWKVLDSSNFGVPQKRKRIYIVGHKKGKVSLEGFAKHESKPVEFLESGKEVEKSFITTRLLEIFEPKELFGKKIKDKRGGKDNIHSWELGLKGDVSERESKLLKRILTERRKKHWANDWGIVWMDGMPLTLKQIKSFMNYPELSNDLKRLTRLGYLRYEHPKQRIEIVSGPNIYYKREFDETKPKGYNIVTGKLSFPINEIIHPERPVRTLVASDMSRIYVYDQASKGLRKLTRLESLRLSGYPNSYNSEFETTDTEFYDLIGNTVCVPVIKSIAERIIKI